jgi:hypothetical protein
MSHVRSFGCPKLSYTHTNFTGCFKTWFPHVAELYEWALLQTLINDNLLSQLLPDLPFAAATINLGQQSVTDWHLDSKNLVFGLCCIVVFGRFNHRQSAQLILKEPRVVMELRRGDVCFVPSGSVTHRNAPLNPWETRFAMIFYTAGGVFRYIFQGFQLAGPQRISSDMVKEAGQVRWQAGWSLFSTLKSLRDAARRAM